MYKEFQVSGTNKDFIKPGASVGLVIINGGPSDPLTNMAKISPSPLYGRMGNGVKNQDWTSRGAIVWTRNSLSNGSSAHSRPDTQTSLNRNHNRAYGVTRLNGHGYRGQSPEDFMNEITILGVSEASNRKEPKGYFSIITGGKFTSTNNSNKTIYPGDYLRATAPAKEDLVNYKGDGGVDSANGDLTLIYEPYHPYKNKFTNKNIYKCLRTERRDEDQLQSFVDASEKFFESLGECSLSFVAALFPKLGIVGMTRETLVKKMYRELNDPENRNTILDTVFSEYSDFRNTSLLLEPSNPKNSKLNEIQREAPQKFLLYASYHFHNVVDKVFSQSCSFSKPQTNVDILLRGYSL